MFKFSSPKYGSYPHDVAVVEDVVRQQGQGRVTFIPHPGVDNPTGQESTRLNGQVMRVR